ncbi:Hypothetical predicted protein [Olea europaea subsp. europaea]|uniref:Uncharacterized protein n=1 Tax=Olea europaea subsp. europaea TaxID=158383 RepID=A0A8S0TTD3_OLEEU|nr:Hypothetical predicted protein [Olea europaea subsp. europaea]
MVVVWCGGGEENGGFEEVVVLIVDIGSGNGGGCGAVVGCDHGATSGDGGAIGGWCQGAVAMAMAMDGGGGLSSTSGWKEEYGYSSSGLEFAEEKMVHHCQAKL